MNQNLCSICGGEYEYKNGIWICQTCGTPRSDEHTDEKIPSAEDSEPVPIEDHEETGIDTSGEEKKCGPIAKFLAIFIICIRLVTPCLCVIIENRMYTFYAMRAPLDKQSSTVTQAESPIEVTVVGFPAIVLELAASLDEIDPNINFVAADTLSKVHIINSEMLVSFAEKSNPYMLTSSNIPYYNMIDGINLEKNGKLQLPERKEIDLGTDEIKTESGHIILRYSKNQVTPS